MTKTVYFKDEQNDDFGGEQKRSMRVVDENYPYQRKNPLWHLTSFLTYYFFAVPLVFIYSKVRFGLKIKGLKNLRSVKGGCYIYGNHTHHLDNFVPAIISWPWRAFIITGPRAVSEPIARWLVPLWGGVPLNTTEKGKRTFRDYLSKQIDRGHKVAIMPEAHLWPYYNKIRNFSERSFTYPVRHNKPVVGYVLTYRKRKNTAKLPKITVTIGKPIYPDEWKNSKNPKMFLRNKVLKFMQNTVKSEKSFGYIKYKSSK